MAVHGRRISPWAFLADRPDITVRLAHTAPLRGWCEPVDGGWVILLGQHLTQAERTTELAHELGHLSRGGGADLPGMPSTWRPVVARDEAAADRAAAEHLVPADVLAEWIAARGEEPTTADDVADEWEVGVRIAALALARHAAT